MVVDQLKQIDNIVDDNKVDYKELVEAVKPNGFLSNEENLIRLGNAIKNMDDEQDESKREFLQSFKNTVEVSYKGIIKKTGKTPEDQAILLVAQKLFGLYSDEEIQRIGESVKQIDTNIDDEISYDELLKALKPEGFLSNKENREQIGEILENIDSINIKTKREYRKVKNLRGLDYDEYEKTIQEYNNMINSLKEILKIAFDNIVLQDEIIPDDDDRINILRIRNEIYGQYQYDESRSEQLTNFYNRQKELKEQQAMENLRVQNNQKFITNFLNLSDYEKNILESITLEQEYEKIQEILWENVSKIIEGDLKEDDKDFQVLNVWNKLFGDMYPENKENLVLYMEDQIKKVSDIVTKHKIEDLSRDKYSKSQVKIIQLHANIVYGEQLIVDGKRGAVNDVQNSTNGGLTNIYLYKQEIKTRKDIINNKKEFSGILNIPNIDARLSEFDLSTQNKIMNKLLDCFLDVRQNGVYFENRIGSSRFEGLLNCLINCERNRTIDEVIVYEKKIALLSYIEGTINEEELQECYEKIEMELNKYDSVQAYYGEMINNIITGIETDNYSNRRLNKIQSSLKKLNTINDQTPDEEKLQIYKDILLNENFDRLPEEIKNSILLSLNKNYKIQDLEVLSWAGADYISSQYLCDPKNRNFVATGKSQSTPTQEVYYEYMITLPNKTNKKIGVENPSQYRDLINKAKKGPITVSGKTGRLVYVSKCNRAPGQEYSGMAMAVETTKGLQVYTITKDNAIGYELQNLAVPTNKFSEYKKLNSRDISGGIDNLINKTNAEYGNLEDIADIDSQYNAQFEREVDGEIQGQFKRSMKNLSEKNKFKENLCELQVPGGSTIVFDPHYYGSEDIRKLFSEAEVNQDKKLVLRNVKWCKKNEDGYPYLDSFSFVWVKKDADGNMQVSGKGMWDKIIKKEDIYRANQLNATYYQLLDTPEMGIAREHLNIYGLQYEINELYKKMGTAEINWKVADWTALAASFSPTTLSLPIIQFFRSLNVMGGLTVNDQLQIFQKANNIGKICNSIKSNKKDICAIRDRLGHLIRHDTSTGVDNITESYLKGMYDQISDLIKGMEDGGFEAFCNYYLNPRNVSPNDNVWKMAWNWFRENGLKVLCGIGCAVAIMCAPFTAGMSTLGVAALSTIGGMVGGRIGSVVNEELNNIYYRNHSVRDENGNPIKKLDGTPLILEYDDPTDVELYLTGKMSGKDFWWGITKEFAIGTATTFGYMKVGQWIGKGLSERFPKLAKRLQPGKFQEADAQYADGLFNQVANEASGVNENFLNKFGKELLEECREETTEQLGDKLAEKTGIPMLGAIVSIWHSITPGGNINVLTNNKVSFGELNIDGNNNISMEVKYNGDFNAVKEYYRSVGYQYDEFTGFLMKQNADVGKYINVISLKSTNTSVDARNLASSKIGQSLGIVADDESGKVFFDFRNEPILKSYVERDGGVLKRNSDNTLSIITKDNQEIVLYDGQRDEAYAVESQILEDDRMANIAVENIIDETKEENIKTFREMIINEYKENTGQNLKLTDEQRSVLYDSQKQIEGIGLTINDVVTSELLSIDKTGRDTLYNYKDVIQKLGIEINIETAMDLLDCDIDYQNISENIDTIQSIIINLSECQLLNVRDLSDILVSLGSVKESGWNILKYAKEKGLFEELGIDRNNILLGLHNLSQITQEGWNRIIKNKKIIEEFGINVGVRNVLPLSQVTEEGRKNLMENKKIIEEFGIDINVFTLSDLSQITEEGWENLKNIKENFGITISHLGVTININNVYFLSKITVEALNSITQEKWSKLMSSKEIIEKDFEIMIDGSNVDNVCKIDKEGWQRLKENKETIEKDFEIMIDGSNVDNLSKVDKEGWQRLKDNKEIIEKDFEIEIIGYDADILSEITTKGWNSLKYAKQNGILDLLSIEISMDTLQVINLKKISQIRQEGWDRIMKNREMIKEQFAIKIHEDNVYNLSQITQDGWNSLMYAKQHGIESIDGITINENNAYNLSQIRQEGWDRIMKNREMIKEQFAIKIDVGNVYNLSQITQEGWDRIMKNREMIKEQFAIKIDVGNVYNLSQITQEGWGRIMKNREMMKEQFAVEIDGDNAYDLSQITDKGREILQKNKARIEEILMPNEQIRKECLYLINDTNVYLLSKITEEGWNVLYNNKKFIADLEINFYGQEYMLQNIIDIIQIDRTEIRDFIQRKQEYLVKNRTLSNREFNKLFKSGTESGKYGIGEINQTGLGYCYAYTGFNLLKNSNFFEVMIKTSLKKLPHGTGREVTVPFCSKTGYKIKVSKGELNEKFDVFDYENESYRSGRMSTSNSIKGMKILEIAFIKHYILKNDSLGKRHDKYKEPIEVARKQFEETGDFDLNGELLGALEGGRTSEFLDYMLGSDLVNIFSLGKNDSTGKNAIFNSSSGFLKVMLSCPSSQKKKTKNIIRLDGKELTILYDHAYALERRYFDEKTGQKVAIVSNPHVTHEKHEIARDVCVAEFYNREVGSLKLDKLFQE